LTAHAAAAAIVLAAALADRRKVENVHDLALTAALQRIKELESLLAGGLANGREREPCR
jgi:hypothetical protein